MLLTIIQQLPEGYSEGISAWTKLIITFYDGLFFKNTSLMRFMPQA